MKQEIYKDRHRLTDWDRDHSSRCFVHIANSLVWTAIAGDPPPTVPPTSKQYTNAGLPWFDYYQDQLDALKGAERLKQIKSVLSLAREKSDAPLPENESVSPDRVIRIGPKAVGNLVREGSF